jgi:hypothetical protein
MATFVGNKRLDSRPKILGFGTTYTSFKEISFNRPPVKQRKPCQNTAPFINKELRKAVYKKRQLHNKYNKCKTKSNWENYRQQRNLVTKIKKRSIKTYFFERCIGGPKSKDFWPTIKPFITNKGSHFTKNMILWEKDEIINDQNMVAECINDIFINVAKDIGNVTVDSRLGISFLFLLISMILG